MMGWVIATSPNPEGMNEGPQSQPKSLGDFLKKFLLDGSDQVLQYIVPGTTYGYIAAFYIALASAL